MAQRRRYNLPFVTAMFRSLISILLAAKASAQTYTKINLRHCVNERINNGNAPYAYPDLASAQAECSVNSNCKAVYHNGCGSWTHGMWLCTATATYQTSSASCLYEKGASSSCPSTQVPNSNYAASGSISGTYPSSRTVACNSGYTLPVAENPCIKR